MTGALYAKVDGEWVPVSTGGGGGGGGTDEVWIGTDEPVDSALELWYDPDDNTALQGSSAWNNAWGVVASASVITSQTGIGNTLTDLTGTSVTFTPVAGRNYQVVGQGTLYGSAAGIFDLVIADGANTMIGKNSASAGVGYVPFANVRSQVFTLPGGVPYTVKLRALATAGVLTIDAVAGRPTIITVEDVGPVTRDSGPDVTPTMQWNAAWGTVAYAQVTSTLPIAFTVADLAGLSVSFTALPGRRYRTTLSVPVQANTAANILTWSITDAANVKLMERSVTMAAASEFVAADADLVEDNLSGVITRKARIRVSAGTASAYPSALLPAFIMVEDIGPVAGATAIENPTPAMIWNSAWGTIGQSFITTQQTGITSRTQLIGSVVNVSTTAGRRYRISAMLAPFMQAAVVGTAVMYIIRRDVNTNLNIRSLAPAANDASQPCYFETYVDETVSGAHVYDVTIERQSSSSGTVANYADGGVVSIITVEDVGPTAGAIPVENPTPTMLWNTAWGVVGHSGMTANTTGIGSGAWVSILPVTFTAVAGRRYMVEYHGGIDSNHGASQVGYIGAYLTSGQQLNAVSVQLLANPGPGDYAYLGSGSYTGTFTPGPVTINLSCFFTSGNGNAFLADVNNPAQITVTDIGPVSGAIAIPDPTPAWIPFPFDGTWSNFDGGYQTAQYRKVGDVVYLRGLVKNTGSDPIVGTLPVGYRPFASIIFHPSVWGGSNRLDVAAVGGTIRSYGQGDNTYPVGYLSLDGIQFSVTP